MKEINGKLQIVDSALKNQSSIANTIGSNRANTVVAIGGAVITAITDKEEKIEISKAQQIELQETAPEFYRANKEIFVVNEQGNTKTTDILSMAKEYYSNAKTPDEKLSNLVGNIAGGAVASKTANTISSKYNNQIIKTSKNSIKNLENIELHEGKQGKHVVGHNNFQVGK